MNALVACLWLATQIQATGQCPGASDVERRLLPLLPGEVASAAADLATITEESSGGGVVLALARPDGSFIAQRRLPRAATCAEQAETVAVAIAVWEAEIHPEIALRLDRLGTEPPSVAVSSADVVRRATPAATTRAWTFGIGAAALGSWQEGAAAPGGRVEISLGVPHGPWRLRLAGTVIGPHTASFPPGQAQWWRSHGALGADHSWALGPRWKLVLGAAGLMGVATVEGSGYSSNRTTRNVDVGVEGMLRVQRRMRAVTPWAGVAAAVWLRGQTLDVTGLETYLVLPRIEPLLALGADFDW